MGIERNYESGFVAQFAAAEKQVQQAYRPVIGVHKWFARRPGALFRSLVLSELADVPVSDAYLESHDFEGRVVLDPFMGGGTTLFEANRLGLSVLGYDTNPMSRWIVERELEPLDIDAFEAIGESICQVVEAQLSEFYETRCTECHDDVPVKSFLWAKTHECTNGHRTLLLNSPLIAGRKMNRHTHDVLVCGRCGNLHQASPNRRPKRCPYCKSTYAESTVRRQGTCPECAEPFTVPEDEQLAPYRHTLVAIEYHCAKCRKRKDRRGRFFKAPDGDDHARYERAVSMCSSLDSSRWPSARVPVGDETRRLHRWGYHRFTDLHNPRQLLGLHVLAEEIRRQPRKLRYALATVYSDFIRYQNMVCRYDAAALKILDVFSIHAFPVSRVQCEAALIGLPGVGSGGYRHFLKKYALAKRYCAQPFETLSLKGRRQRVPIEGECISGTFVRRHERLAKSRRVALETASISAKPPADESVDMVLTDPPYFANVQYSELMDFCYTWLRQIVRPRYFKARTSRSLEEVTGNTHEGRDLEHFAASLSAVYCKAARALKRGGPFAFTYHHNESEAYAAIIVACLDAGLIPQTTFVCPSEMRGSVHIANSNSSRVDSVFVLRKPPAPAGVVGNSVEERVLRAARTLEEVGVPVTDGDRRCIRFGFRAEAAMHRLLNAWDANAPIGRRVALADEAMSDSTPVFIAPRETAEPSVAVA
ncbi:MAG: DNA methyltransferase [Solirubrobacterales bacterium]